MKLEDKFIKSNDFIKYDIKSMDEVNLRNLEVVNKNKQLGLIGIEIEQFNEDLFLIYNLKEFKSLKEYLLNPLSKEMAYSLLKSINNSLSMQCLVLDTGIISLDTSMIYVKEICNIPYCYFIYVPNEEGYNQNKDDVKKLIFSIIISIEDNELRSKALTLYSANKLEEVIDLLRVDGMNFIKNEDALEVEPKLILDDKLKDDEGTTTEVKEDETTLIDYEETTLIDEKVDFLSEATGKLIINNNGIFTEEHIFKNSTIMGRLQSCDIVISNRVISKRHAEITIEGTDYYIKDIGSKNGTFVNDKRLGINEKVKLSSKDKIKLGNVYCSFER